MKKRGSITAYLSLIILLFLSLFLQCLNSVRISHARELTACAASQGLYSLFGQYDRTLLKEYELLFVDGGYGTSEYRTDLMGKVIQSYADEMLHPLQAPLLRIAPLSAGSVTEVSFASIAIASDQNGAAFQRQIIEAMKANLTSAGVQLLLQKLSGEEQKADDSLADSRREAIADYKDAQTEAAREQEEKDGEEEAEEKTEVKVPENFKNPIETISEMMTRGILALILPETQKIPSGTANIDQFLSHRTLQTGFGTIGSESGTDAGDAMLLRAYALWKFQSYVAHSEQAGLTLQQEYLLEGKDSDAENLKCVLTKLLAIREGVNLAYLWSDPEKVSEMTAMAELILAALALPIAMPVVMHALAVCWAFAESVAEVRALTRGDKVPLLPNAASWRISLERLADFTGESTAAGEIRGLNYQEYLAVLMAGMRSEKLLLRMMDLVEYNMRTRFEKPDFRLDHCVDEVEIIMKVNFSQAGSYTISRSYGYEEKV